jgi:hypothetical protein
LAIAPEFGPPAVRCWNDEKEVTQKPKFAAPHATFRWIDRIIATGFDKGVKSRSIGVDSSNAE